MSAAYMILTALLVTTEVIMAVAVVSALCDRKLTPPERLWLAMALFQVSGILFCLWLIVGLLTGNGISR